MRSESPALWHLFGNRLRKKVMNNYEAACFIEEKLPEAHVFENTGRLTFDINKTVGCLTDFMKKRFLVNDMLSVKKNVADSRKDIY
jgi:hypothetical protein